MGDLSNVPFRLDQAIAFKFAPNRNDSTVDDPDDRSVCATCPHNSANDAELTQDMNGAHVCTDRPCFELKVKAFWKARRDEATATGRTILIGAEAAAAIPSVYGGFNSAYVDLDAQCSDMQFPEKAPPADAPDAEQDAYYERQDNWRAPTYRELLGVEAPTAVLAEASKGELHELVPLKEARPLLKAKGVNIVVPAWMKEREHESSPNAGVGESPAAFEKRRAEAERERQEIEVEKVYRRRLLLTVCAKYKAPLQRAELEAIAEHEIEATYFDDDDETLNTLCPGGVNKLDKLSDAELIRVIVYAMLTDETNPYHGTMKRTTELARSLSIDAKKIRADVVRDLKPVSAPKDETSEKDGETKPEARKAKTAAKKKPAVKKAPAKKAAKK